MTYDEALEYIHGINWSFCKPGLERTLELCRGLGDPQSSLRFVHVVGTNGKGSFCSMLSSILVKAGYRTGLYTSPYVVRFNERMRVNGASIPDDTLAEITSEVRRIADAMQDKPTEFELITAIAFEYFKRSGCQVVVLEAGMGGRLDSTNVIRDPLLSVITGISLDHTAILGNTVERIAEEKAGVIKDGAPVLFGGVDKEALAVIERVAAERGSELHLTDYEALKILSCDLDGTTFDYGSHRGMRLRMLGGYQPRNAASVLSAVELLRLRGLTIDEAAVRSGLEEARWPARFEILSTDPLIIFDGAHNPEGISAAVESISHYFPTRRVYAVTGVLADKDHGFIAKELSRVVSRAFTITPSNPRALSAESYAEELKGYGVCATPSDSVADAIAKAKGEAARTGTPILILGSLYTYVEVLLAMAD